jgi:energy-coupling factor transporter ATP-binding protein EcfA2
MKLTKVRIQNYKSISDSGWVEMDQVACLVGKNESGKTAFLQALEKLNPVEKAHADFNYVYEYPTSKYTSYKRRHDENPDTVVEAEFEVTNAEAANVARLFGPDTLTSRKVVVTKDYRNETSWNVTVDKPAAVKHLASTLTDGSEALTAAATAATTVAELLSAIEAHGAESEAAGRLQTRIKAWHQQNVWQGVVRHLELPRFFYFDDYSVMRGMVSLDDLIRRVDEGGEIDDSEKPFLALLDLIGVTPEEIRDETDIESLTRELEGASVTITDEMFEFWRQNDELTVQFVRQPADPNAPAPLNTGKILAVRIWNPNHRASVPFDQRSKGFVWFFSFLVSFQKIKDAKETTILLLDEPALSLHALAQGDFLRFTDERLAPAHQVIYSTHSPFMVHPSHLDRVRTVTDLGRDKGTVVSDEVFRTDKDTLFPLQAALGYELAQTLFVGAHNLAVEGPSDYIYLDLLSAAVEVKGGEPLDDRWTIVPVGGADKLSTFVTLLGGNQLDVVALMDVSNKDRQRVDNLLKNGHLMKNGLVQINEFTDESEADIEDLFAPMFYLKLAKGAYKAKLGGKALTLKALGAGSPRITKRIEKYFETEDINNGVFKHQPPAAFLLREQAKLMPSVDDATLKRAEAMFQRINALIK